MWEKCETKATAFSSETSFQNRTDEFDCCYFGFRKFWAWNNTNQWWKQNDSRWSQSVDISITANRRRSCKFRKQSTVGLAGYGAGWICNYWKASRKHQWGNRFANFKRTSNTHGGIDESWSKKHARFQSLGSFQRSLATKCSLGKFEF